jgi:hypothetical protein
MPQFSWGNLQSLKEIPEAKNGDPLTTLREFYKEVSDPYKIFLLVNHVRLIKLAVLVLLRIQHAFGCGWSLLAR